MMGPIYHSIALCLKSKGAVEVHSLPLQAAEQTLPLSKYFHWHLCPRPYLCPGVSKSSTPSLYLRDVIY